MKSDFWRDKGEGRLVHAEPAVTVGDVTVIPLSELSWRIVLGEEAAGMTASKSPVAVVVRFPDRIAAFRMDGSEISQSEMQDIPDLEDLEVDL
ncbi:MAG: hypothetical protein A4E45_00800 [Methanosaeta sp. PtaB.Bin039]|nr:MAG: hypothetical protein A4E45_00800 [Methanosaeta sp. PtaB.Bin039]OPY44360.1 MAG: hypothetical protein A4E47_01593 [Methanosaeta sp. PtaU1.Bin028]HOT06224.1 hypothetical protein [Methanotrichaceae archaeon]HQF15466.1 hypothetical protein [Methanotrichaceae archaeon]HQI90201.1 hypothetical protein [Methanotrichaceae archaeon]